MPAAPKGPSFLDKLTASLDTPTKTKLVASALGELLPGERVIMFLNSLKDVRDSQFNHSFAGSEDMLERRGLGGVFDAGGAGDVGGSENGVGVTTVWCCVMTFYRVAVFSYRATLDGKVLLDGCDESGGSNNCSSSKEGIVEQWINSQSVSVQFQAAHRPLPATSSPNSGKSQFNKQHHVFQMPLASVERVEKKMSSSQTSVAGVSPTSTSGYGASSGGYSYNAILPSSSSVSSTMTSTATSAMSSLGSQMKPLLGGMSGSTSNSNLIANSSSSNSNHAAAGGSNVGNSAGPLGIVLHGKDGGRWIQFSANCYSDAQRAQEALNTYAFPGRRNLGYLFAFESRRAEVVASNQPPQNPPPNVSGVGGVGGAEGEGNPIATAAQPTRRRFVPMEEFGRQGIFKQRSGGPASGGDGWATTTHASPWAPILNANASYGLCSTYPGVLVGPRSIVVGDPDAGQGTGRPGVPEGDVGLLRRCAAFRSENRFPVLTWGSSAHGGSIWRSSQPKVGLQGNRSPDDERYLRAIGEEAKRANLAADARDEGGVGGGGRRGGVPVEFLRMLCGRNNEGDLVEGTRGGEGSGCMLKIMDMRPKSAAMGNRTQGEHSEVRWLLIICTHLCCLRIGLSLDGSCFCPFIECLYFVISNSLVLERLRFGLSYG